MENDEKKFVKKINVDKAKNKTEFAIACFIVSILSYVIPFFEMKLYKSSYWGKK